MLFIEPSFIFCFLPLMLLAYWLLSRSRRSRLMLLALSGGSLLFCGWHEPKFAYALAASILGNYAIALGMVRCSASASRRLLLFVGLGLNLLYLGYFKYAGFACQILSDVSGWRIGWVSVALPLGISFYTFQQIGFLVDSHRAGRVKESLLEYASFVLFFPQLIAGPIVRHDELIPQFRSELRWSLATAQWRPAATIFTLGLCKKLLLADSCALYADQVFALAKSGVDLNLGEAWLGIVSYSHQIYFDFSAYSDMAIGLGLLFGVRLPTNFNSPYKSASIEEFWRRWHMTLSGFLRDYVYIPMGGNRHGELRRHRNTVLTMLLAGLWHGANWTFVLWGGLHGAAIVFCRLWAGTRVRVPRPIGIATTFVFVSLSWAFFRGDTVTTGTHMVKSALLSPACGSRGGAHG